jgi:hypothetical protein
MPRIKQVYSDLINQQFPGVPWTGHSDIHLSVGRTAHLDKVEREWSRSLMASLICSNWGTALYDWVDKTFEGLSWFMDRESLASLALYDLYVQSTGGVSIKTKNRLTNPRTGNRFHRIAIKDTTVVGIRFWQEGGQVGFRVRLEELDEAEATSRARTADAVNDASYELALVKEKMDLDYTEAHQQAGMALIAQTLKIQPVEPDEPDDYDSDDGPETQF